VLIRHNQALCPQRLHRPPEADERRRLTWESFLFLHVGKYICLNVVDKIVFGSCKELHYCNHTILVTIMSGQCFLRLYSTQYVYVVTLE